MSLAVIQMNAPHRAGVSRVDLDLPEPPSTNELFANTSHERRAAAMASGRKLPGRVKTVAYKTWLNAAGWMLTSQRPGRIEGRYTLEVWAARSGKDLGNLEKALSDLLVEHGVIADDSLSTRITLEWNDELPTRQIRVSIRAAS